MYFHNNFENSNYFYSIKKQTDRNNKALWNERYLINFSLLEDKLYKRTL